MDEFETFEKLTNEWKKVQRMKRLNQELYDLLGGSLVYLVKYAEKNKIVLPNRDALYSISDRVHGLMDSINQASDESYHQQNRDQSYDKLPEPQRPFKYVLLG